jgi:hypothetical protein
MSQFKTNFNTVSLKEKFENLYESIDKNNTSKIIAERYLKTISSIEVNESVEDVDSTYFLNRIKLLENSIRELRAYNWMPQIKNFIVENEKVLVENKLYILIESTLFNLKRDRNFKFFEKAINKLSEAKDSDNPVFYVVENLGAETWIPEVKSIFEYCKNLKGSIEGENPNFKITKIYSPIEPVNESQFLFYSNGKTLLLDGQKIEESENLGSDNFKGLVSILESSRISDKQIRFYTNKSIIDVNFGEETTVSVNGKSVDSSILESYLLSGGHLRYSDKSNIRLYEMAINEGMRIKEIDFGYKITSNLYEGVSASVFNLGGKIYIHKINSGMKENQLIESTSASDAVNIVKSFMNYDISNSVKDILESETLEAEKKEVEINKIQKRIKFIIEKLAEVEKVESELGSTKKIEEAKNILESELKQQSQKLNVLEGVEIAYDPATTSKKGPGTDKIPSKNDLRAGKEYSVNGKPGYIFQGVADDVYIFNHKDETDPTPIHMNNVEVENSISKGEITECY